MDLDGRGGFRGWSRRLAARVAAAQGGLLYANLARRGLTTREIRERQLATALEIRPHSQSAVLALAALKMREGEASSAYDLAETSLVKRRNDDDPWRLFLYGHHPHLPKLVADLRSKTR